MAKSDAYMVFTLHTHLPFVLNHGRWPHGSDWLNEAAFECYLPLLEVAHHLVADGISPKWTVNLSPVLTEQLAQRAGAVAARRSPRELVGPGIDAELAQVGEPEREIQPLRRAAGGDASR